MVMYGDAVRETNTIVFEFIFPSAVAFVSLEGKIRRSKCSPLMKEIIYEITWHRGDTTPYMLVQDWVLIILLQYLLPIPRFSLDL